MNTSKTLEQLESDIWKEPKEFQTGLVERCFKYRKIPIDTLTNEQLRTLLSQNIGTKYLLSIVLEILTNNPLAEGDLYEGDLLESAPRGMPPRGNLPNFDRPEILLNLGMNN